MKEIGVYDNSRIRLKRCLAGSATDASGLHAKDGKQWKDEP